ncbi:MAG: ABC transporter permease [Bryobacterales bacterium]
MTTILHSYFMTLRLMRHLLRQPWYIALTLVQPVIWLVFYGQLFEKVTALPGFETVSYIDFLTPGIVVMSALFSSGWSGMGMIHDLDRGVMDRFLVSPASRSALIAGRLLHLAFQNCVTGTILITLGLVLGARYPGGITGVAVLLLCAVLLAIPFGALSNALALTLRKQESVIGAVNFVLLPLVFLSPVFMAPALMPEWIRTVAQLNPVGWSVTAGRAALHGNADWSAVVVQVGCLTAFTFFSGWLATRAFQSYQRSV